jgi:hypothetical protein
MRHGSHGSLLFPGRQSPNSSVTVVVNTFGAASRPKLLTSFATAETEIKSISSYASGDQFLRKFRQGGELGYACPLLPLTESTSLKVLGWLFQPNQDRI